MKNRPLFYVFAGVVLGEGCFCINKIMAGAVTAFCLIAAQKVCGCFFSPKRCFFIKKYIYCLVLGMIMGILLPLGEARNEIEEEGIEGKITGIVKMVGAGETEVIQLGDLSAGGKRYDGNALLYGPSDQVLPGYLVCINTKIEPYETPGNPGQFDLNLYYRCRNIYYSGFYDEIDIIKPTEDHLLTVLHRLKVRWVTTCRKHLSEKDAGVLCAVLLGEKSFLDEGLNESYQRNGIAHILAISGLHISMIGSTLYRLLKKTGLSFVPAGLISFAIMIPYCIMIGSAVAALRAVIMFILFLGSNMKGRTYDFLTSASLAGLLILIENPLYLWDASFLLSFGAIFAIGCVFPCFKKIHAGQTLWLGISVWIILFPIQLWFFYEMSPFSTLLNFIVIPLMPCLVGCGFLGLLTDLHSFFKICHIILAFYESILVFPSYMIGKPKMISLVVYGVIIVCFCLLIQSKKYGFSAVCMLFGILVLLIPPAHGFRITFLDVGQGDCIVVESPSGHHYMIDGGSSDVSKVAKYRILPYLKSQGIPKLDYVVITHFDEDHDNGILEMLESGYRIDHLIVYQNTDQSDEDFLLLQKETEKQNIPILFFSRNDFLKDQELSFKCLFPEKDYTAEKNQQSLVFWLQYRGFSCLLTGDLEKEGEDDLCDFWLPKVNLLKAGHHGSKDASSEMLLSKTTPQYAVISCGQDNRYGHPNPETLKRLEKENITIFQTPKCGAIWAREVRGTIAIGCYKK